LEMLLDI